MTALSRYTRARGAETGGTSTTLHPPDQSRRGGRSGQRLHPAGPGRLGHLPPHLREVCALLAAGLLRLLGRAAEDQARDAALHARDLGESSLHSPPGQSGHATPNRRTA